MSMLLTGVVLFQNFGTLKWCSEYSKDFEGPKQSFRLKQNSQIVSPTLERHYIVFDWTIRSKRAMGSQRVNRI